MRDHHLVVAVAVKIHCWCMSPNDVFVNVAYCESQNLGCWNVGIPGALVFHEWFLFDNMLALKWHIHMGNDGKYAPKPRDSLLIMTTCCGFKSSKIFRNLDMGSPISPWFRATFQKYKKPSHRKSSGGFQSVLSSFWEGSNRFRSILFHGNHMSMDWFKGKLEPERPIFSGKIHRFL